jgi:hypothetical protein
MDTVSLPIHRFRHGERVFHPRAGYGRFLRWRENGTVVVRFDGKPKDDVLFPFLLTLAAPQTVQAASEAKLAPSWRNDSAQHFGGKER